jgi:hypothetical protein
MKFTALVVGGAVLVLAAIILFSPKTSKTETSGAMSTTDATYQMDKTSANLGDMSVDEVKSADFIITNTGSDTLELSHFATSCDCTSAIVKIGSKTSPEFGMGGMMSAGAASWQGKLPAGQIANISVTYTPSKMPVYGVVERTLTFMANNKNITLTVKANVK